MEKNHEKNQAIKRFSIQLPLVILSPFPNIFSKLKKKKTSFFLNECATIRKHFITRTIIIKLHRIESFRFIYSRRISCYLLPFSAISVQHMMWTN